MSGSGAAAGDTGRRPAAAATGLDFARDGADWPLRAASRFVVAGGLRWHVQLLGVGPALLLVHGTGAASHSWRGLAPLLAPRWTIISPDLPGHGFSAMPPVERLSMAGMADALAALLAELGVTPALVVGHSAGAALLARMCLDGLIRPRLLVSLNGALLPLRGLAGQLFSPAAKLLAALPPAARLIARRNAERAVIERILATTGSRIEAQGVELYRRLAADPGHVAAALGMMASWDPTALARDLPRLATPLALVIGSEDRTVRPAEARRVRALVPGARVTVLPGLGHLAHEERPELVAELIERLARTVATPPL